MSLVNYALTIINVGLSWHHFQENFVYSKENPRIVSETKRGLVIL